ncbi:PREDICTED: alpha-2-macroglobulin-like protein 1 [Nanorana parkeri]|uniref:alpha-2-macroglobulin-like protein 1 n=1 Tax=Nanorana parkeri TaxID=125878 RepID=UPI0008543F81|nr:PREDICTED: alpha-2-macroglobulin-like protein 1 [Nanorana parkeri]
MGLLLFSICLFIFGPPLASTSEPYYMVTVPAQMVYPSQDRACVLILHLQGEIKLKMALKKDDTIHQVAEDIINTPNYVHCYSFQLPAVVEDEVWLFHVSMDGEHLHLEKTKKVLIYKRSHVTFIQTDKPYYKPGQTVNFRIVTLDNNFQAQNKKYPLVEIMDPDNNRIAQWLDVTPNQGIASLSFPLANELNLGDYTINIPETYRVTFSVSEYVLRRYSINIEVPSILDVMTDDAVIVKACSSYTYGKPVIGLMSLSLCKVMLPSWFLNYADDTEGILYASDDDLKGCIHIKDIQTDDKGCISKTFDLSLFNISQTDSSQHLKVRALMTEKVTGNTEHSAVVSRLGTVEYLAFSEEVEFYQQGVPLTVKLMLKDRKESPKVNETVYLVVGFEAEDLNLTAVTNELGLATFNLDTSSWEDMVSIMGKISLEEDEEKEKTQASNAYAWLHPFYSESNSFLKVLAVEGLSMCDTQQLVTVEYVINKKKLDPNSDHQSFFYILMSKGIVSVGEYKLDITEQPAASDLHGTFHLKFSKAIELFPKATILVFTVLLNGDIAAGRTKFEVPMCPNNKVQLKYSKDEVHPGEMVSLEVKAESGSFCSVRSVDKGVLLHKQHEKFNLPTMMIMYTFHNLEVNRRGLPYKIEDFEKYPCLRNENDPSPEIHEGVWYYSHPDVYRLLKESNLKVFTNTKIRKPVLCSLPNYTKRISPKKENTLEKNASKNEVKKAIIRRLFPETWLFDLVSVGPYGSTVLNLTTPDSITKFDTDAFCLGKSGFGEISNVMLTAFKPYFIELIMPYSVVQGEKFTITAMVYNYLKECMMWSLIPLLPLLFQYCSFVDLRGLPSNFFNFPSSDWKVFTSLSYLRDHSTLDSKDQKQCIGAEESTSFTWNVTASNLGSLKVHVSSASIQLKGGCSDPPPNLGKDHQEDSTEKTIIVKPPGLLEEKTQTSLLCPSGDSVHTEVSLNLPDRVVPGSDQALLTVLGDLMGSAIANLGQAISHPEGSGERNLVTFLPNVQIVKYLEATNQLTPKIKSEALTYMTKGYQRQLMFKSENGSYSVFHGYKPSAWLTAFTLRSFVHAQELIYIQEKHIEDAVRWLGQLQQANGCFETVGSIFQDYLREGGEDEVTLTAYITIALLEYGKVFNGTMVDRALKCLKDSVDTVNCTYTQALMAYAFTLSGDGDLRKQMLESLEESAEKTGGTKHWGTSTQGHGGVEISAYVVLAILSKEATSHKDIEEASSIVSWMVKTQRPQGGFYATQDTVVGLQAFTKYAKATYRDEPDVTVFIRSLSGFQRQFHVDKTNSLLLQKEPLPDTSGVYTVTATGNGCVLVQTHLNYNIQPEKSDTHFSLTISTQPAVCTKEVLKKLDINMEVSYSGEHSAANIVIIEVDMLSGFLPDKKSLKKLKKKKSVVERTEATGDKVTIYLYKLTHEPVTLAFLVEQEVHVNNLQPAIVKVYDYSSPDKLAVATYNSPCSTESPAMPVKGSQSVQRMEMTFIGNPLPSSKDNEFYI